MVKIKKSGGAKHDATLSPGFSAFIERASAIDLPELPKHLSTFPALWPFPRGDLYHWIPLLNRFDHILEIFSQEYGLKNGPQTRPFSRRILLRGGDASAGTPVSDPDLDKLGFGPEGDRQLVEAVLDFSRLLLQNCGNRSLYSSSSFLNDLLNTSSSTLLHHTLRLTVCLAQRYNASRQRSSAGHMNTALLASHYNINLDKVHKLALPFMRSVPSPEQDAASPMSTSSAKGKEKLLSIERVNGSTRVYANDLTAIVSEVSERTKPASVGISGEQTPSRDSRPSDWKDWGDVLLTYYPSAPQETSPSDGKRGADHGTSSGSEPSAASQPSLVRRTTDALQHTSRRRQNLSDQSEPGDSMASNALTKDDVLQAHGAGAMRVIAVGADRVVSTPIWEIMASVPPEVPLETKYELLCRLRVASALALSPATRQEALGIRILAITNLAYIYSERSFQQRVLQQDTDEPRRLQLAQQLAELVHPSDPGVNGAQRWLQTLALGALEALAKMKSKAADVSAALNVNVNHGVLFYVLRKAILELASDDSEGEDAEDEEWREALFSLVAYLPNIARTGGSLVSAGLLPILLEALSLRSQRAERMHPKVIEFLNVFIYHVRDPFQVLANVGGLDILSALVAYEVESGYDRALKGEGVPAPYRNQHVDYEMPYFQHQTLRRLFKYINHMMTQNGLTLDRLLRNLIDSPQLLGGLRKVLSNSTVFGSSVWSGAVDIMSNFIHNEPTSYAVIAEAGLGKAFLEAVSREDITGLDDAQNKAQPHDGGGDDAPGVDILAGGGSAEPRQGPSTSTVVTSDSGPNTPELRSGATEIAGSGILPASEAIGVVPHAFGAICLNAAGMALFQRSKALQNFFKIFESPEHVRRMDIDSELPNMLGTSIDELVRHHPPLKEDIFTSVISMVQNVCKLCQDRANAERSGLVAVSPMNANHGYGDNHIPALGVAATTTAAAAALDRGQASADSEDVEMEDAPAVLPPDAADELSAEPIAKELHVEGGPSVSTYIDVTAKFLGGFFTNPAVCTSFIERGGAEVVLGFVSIPNLPCDFVTQPAGSSLSRAIHFMVEQKPHLVLPSLVKLGQASVASLQSFLQDSNQKHAFFLPLLDQADKYDGSIQMTDDAARLNHKRDVLACAKSLVTAHNVCNILAEAFSQPMANHRSNYNVFSQVNLTDMYTPLVGSLGRLSWRCLIEEHLLQRSAPSQWKESTHIKGLNADSSEADEIMGMLQSYREVSDAPRDSPATAATSSATGQPRSTDAAAAGVVESSGAPTEARQKSVQQENFNKLHFLLGSLPSTITAFFRELGSMLVTKRISDTYQKQNSAFVAEAIADAAIEQLQAPLPEGFFDESEKHSYWNMSLTALTVLMFEVAMDRSPSCLTLILQAFKNRGGFEAIVRILDQLVDAYNRAQSLNGHPTPADATKSKIVASSIDVIVNFFLHVVTPRTITEASQTTAMVSRDRARDKQDYFAPGQFLVELKMAVLIPVQALLGSKFVEGAPGSTVKKLVDMLRIILESDHEQGAFKRSENILRRVRVPPKPWKEAADKLERLVGSGYSEDVAREALFRCNDNIALAEDYCAFMKRNDRVGRNPIPGQVGPGSGVASQIPSQPAAESSAAEADSSDTTNSTTGNAANPVTEQPTAQDRSPMEIDATEDTAGSIIPPHPGSVGQLGDESALDTLTFENFLDLEGDSGRPRAAAPLENDGNQKPGQSSVPGADSDSTTEVVTADDLEEKRVEIRGRIIELALDVLNVHSGITFELADLILAAVPKSSPQADSVRTEIGETLVQSLISLQADDFRNVGKKIAAYAHLLALILRDKAFYEATLKEVKSSLPALLDFIKVFPDQTLEESSPWISEVLLVLEALLSDDAQPRQVKWTPPTSTTTAESTGAADLEEPVVPEEHKTRLFDAVLDILPRVGRDSSLALSVVRVLVMLSRNSQLAARLGEKRNLQRLFVMIKQLAGLTSGKLQSAFMLVLRHIIEDDETIKQTMRSAIRSYFENRTSTRQVDTNAYVRNFSHLVLRSPELFVEVSNEILKLSRFDPSQKHQSLVLRHPPTPTTTTENSTVGQPPRPPEETEKGDADNVMVQPGNTAEETSAPKTSAAEATAAMVEHPDGVIHYLLSELLSYKEVHARETASSLREKADTTEDHQAADTEMTDREPTSGSSSSIAPERASEVPQAPSDAAFRAEQHPIFVYHCFILQCLTELLSSYTRTKVEFINFSRKAPTPVQSLKPRSGILNYFFHDLIPIGTLNQTEDLPFLKKSVTSSWAISVIVALCSKTSEKYTSQDNPAQEHIDDPALAFVRKFVLEHALKAYNSTASVESLDARYSKILCLADLFNRVLLGSPAPGGGDANETYNQPKVMAQLMLERNFIHALTASIAEIDLNYPLAKRAVKYVLRPLEALTRSAVELNETISISSFTGQPEDDEIPSASSISDAEEGREETPDLFRNSTLGLFEPGRENDTSSSASDEDEDALYDEEYGDEMDYEENMADGNEMSDEEGMSDIEGLPGDVGLDVEVVVDEDDDENDEDSPDDEDELNEMDAEGDGQSIAEDHNEEWESDNDDADEDDNDEDEDDEDESGFNGNELQGGNATSHNQPHTDNSMQHIVRALGGGEDDSGMLQQLSGGEINMELDAEAFMEDDMQEDEEISEDEDDEDEMEDDEDAMYGANYEEAPNFSWGWRQEGGDHMAPRGDSHTHGHLHHHHHHRATGNWSLFGSGRDAGLIVPNYRSHRSAGGQNRGNDDFVHPLLQRTDTAAAFGRDDRDEMMSDWISALQLGGRGRVHTDIPMALINNIISVIGHSSAALHRHGASLHLHLTPPLPRARDIHTSLGTGQPSHAITAQFSNSPAHVVSFLPVVTSGRWLAEARLLFGQESTDKAQRIIDALLFVLVPPAVEEEKLQKEKSAAEEARKRQEEKEQEAERERAAQKKLEDEREEQRRLAESQSSGGISNDYTADVTRGEQSEDVPPQAAEPEPRASADNDSMEGVETTQPSSGGEGAEPAPSGSPAHRVRTTIRGRELDITGMDIDPEYLDALPEELREEVLMHQIAERRSQAASSGEQPTNISREFLEALPADIREELLEQEAQDRRRREREEARRRVAASSGPTQAAGEDMDPASVLATLEPSLRQAILMEQDEDVLAQLPQELAAEARALGSEHRLRHYIEPGRLRPRDAADSNETQDASTKKPQRKPVPPLLDKAGIATLLRLMFIPQQDNARESFNSVLQSICENKQNRVETVSLLLSILQDCSADVAAVDKTFAQLSLRARQCGPQKSAQTSKRAQDQVPRGICDVSPLAVVQQCLNTLVLLVQNNPHLQFFFLTEHDTSTGLKRVPSKKGKAKENKASRFALNSLLGLLDRKLVMESPTVMERLSTLLNSITQPLSILARKDKEPDPEAAVAPQSSTQAETSVSIPDGAPDASNENQSSAPADAQRDQASEDSATGEGPAQAQASNPGTSEVESKKEEKPQEASKVKKVRTLAPPVVSEGSLRLVVNILTARECSATTFRDTLSTINNLSAIPGARDVFGKELLRQAQLLGQSILGDLGELTAQINKAQLDTDVQGLALVKFSPSSSSQAKLLRVLTALDYLFDTLKDSGKREPVPVEPEASSSSEPKDLDLLTSLSNNARFSLLWTRLSECLSAIRQKESIMVNLATILLPLIEALMVICKNTTLKASAGQRIHGVEIPTAVPPQSPTTDTLEDLFFRFTEEHRKVLNELVRHNPKLMSGTFSLLVKNPKVLEFDNKRNYFTRRLHARGTETRHTQAPLQLSVRRDHVFLDSFKSLYFKSGDEMKYGKLSIRFHGEEGVDAGGVTREWFQVLSRQMFNPDYALFTPVASDRTTFHPNRLSAVNPEHLMFFKFIGRIIGKALYEGRVLDCHFSRAVYKRILGKPVSLKDMETLDLDYYKSLLWMLENDITDIITETFSVETEAFGETQIIDLIENGRHVAVTEQNKHEYVRLVVEYRLTGSVHEQLEHFLTGFHDIVPAELISIFNEQELELLISGLPDIDVDDWKNNTEYHNYTPSSPQIQWFWRAVRSFDKEERAKLLQFVTGTSKVPLNGFKELEGMNGFSRFNIHRDYGSKERLPSSHTCFNQLDLPEYDSYESLRSHVYTAMTAGSEYFGFA